MNFVNALQEKTTVLYVQREGVLSLVDWKSFHGALMWVWTLVGKIR